MDRQIVYAGAIPQDVDQLLQNKNAMIGLGYLIQAILGTSTTVDGLACTPTSPPTLTVNVAPGSIYSIENIDNSAYGSVAADTTHQIMKQGIELAVTNLSCPAPTTSGFSVNYLVEAAYEDSDGGSEVLPYYNASNPAVAYNGPNNTGVSQNTVRQGICQILVKAGIAATTGTQTTPAPDAGFVGLFAVTVANGQTTITSGNIQQLNTAPFINPKLTGFGALALLGVGAGLISNGGNLVALAQRPTLTANQTYYVDPAGSDSNDGLTSGTPFLTLQKAINVVQAIDLNSFSVTINVDDGTYTAGVVVPGPWVGNGTVTLQGNFTTPDNCIISTTSSDCIQALQGGVLSYGGFKFNTTTSGRAVHASGPGSVLTEVASCDYGAIASGSTHVQADIGATILLNASYKITAGAANHWGANGGRIIVNAPTITLTGTPAFTDFASCSVGLITVTSGTTTFSGTATGARYNVISNGVIGTASSGSTYLPGNASGTSSTGGQYV